MSQRKLGNIYEALAAVHEIERFMAKEMPFKIADDCCLAVRKVEDILVKHLNTTYTRPLLPSADEECRRQSW